MNTNRRRSFFRAALTLGGAIVAAVLLSATPADAHGARGGHYRGGVAVGPRHMAPAHFVVPRAIGPHRGGFYQPYYVGQYYGPYHRPYMVYRFPVVVGGSVVYRPYVYSGGQLVIGAAIPPGFFASIQFGGGY